MAKFVKFTNAAQGFDDDDLYINADIVASVFSLIEPGGSDNKLNPYTVIYGVNNIDWRVKESLSEVIEALNNA